MKFGKGSGEYAEFLFTDIVKARTTALRSRLENVAAAAEKYLDALSDYAQTPEEIAALRTAAQNYDVALQRINSAKGERRKKAVERIELSNRVYTLAATYSKLAQAKFGTMSYVMYKSYQITRKLQTRRRKKSAAKKSAS